MHIAAIIPARGGSKGLKNKNMYPILSKPLIQWTFEQVKNTKSLDSVFVTTDDINIIDLATKHEINVIKRPQYLSTDLATSESALIHALNVINKDFSMDPDIVVFLQATSPLRKIDDINNAINLFINEEADSLFSISSLADLTIWQFNNKWESLNFNYKDRKRRQDMPNNYIENGSIYIFTPDILKKYNNRLGGKIVAYEMEFWQTWEIDAIDEVELVEFYMKRYKLD